MSDTKISIAKMLENRPVFFAAHKFFHKTFHLLLTEFLDRELTVYFCKPIIDVYKFDDWLHEMYGEYENERLSMCDALTDIFGESVAMRIKELLI